MLKLENLSYRDNQRRIVAVSPAVVYDVRSVWRQRWQRAVDVRSTPQMIG